MLQRLFKSSCVGLIALAFAFTVPAFGQMPQQPDTTTLSASEVSQEQVDKAARIAAAVQSSMRAQQMKMRKQMKEKYGNPQEMDSTQKANARREMKRQQMRMRKQQMKMMQQESQKENMDPQMFRRIMRSAQQDSTLKKQIQQAMKAEMKKQQSQMQQNPNSQN
ncbi:hypothetical protein [Salinibacter ruber]|uniref:hypothetical protein n=1 Tax=Salinibacter ruber TaxID=146919 RepID=UPI000E58795B|nr:hypothetical protein [Salinibacter ruber]